MGAEWGTLFAIAALLTFGTAFGFAVTKYSDTQQELKHSCAHYGAQTGEFRWNDEVTK